MRVWSLCRTPGELAAFFSKRLSGKEQVALPCSPLSFMFIFSPKGWPGSLPTTVFTDHLPACLLGAFCLSLAEAGAGGILEFRQVCQRREASRRRRQVAVSSRHGAARVVSPFQRPPVALQRPVCLRGLCPLLSLPSALASQTFSTTAFGLVLY